MRVLMVGFCSEIQVLVKSISANIRFESWEDFGNWTVNTSLEISAQTDNFEFSILKDLDTKLIGYRSLQYLLERFRVPPYRLAYTTEKLMISHVSTIRYLRSNEIRVVLVSTGVAHHFDSTCLQLACTDLNIPVVYLRTVPWPEPYGRLLPEVQRGDFATRRHLETVVSSFNFDSLVLRYRQELESTGFAYKLPADRDAQLSRARRLYRHVGRPGRNLIHIGGREKTPFQYEIANSSVGLSDVIRSARARRLYVHSLKIAYENTAKLTNSPKFITTLEKRRPVVIFSHSNPEATNYPQTGNLSSTFDQALRIREVGLKGPIFVKFHPLTILNKTLFQEAFESSSERLSNLRALGCYILPPDNKSYLHKILPGYLPVTGAGSISLERSLQGLDTCVLGFPWWRGIDGTFDANDLPQRLDGHPNLLEKDTVRRSSMDFVLNLLNGKTLTNSQGIGTDFPQPLDSENTASMAGEWRLLIAALQKIARVTVQ